MRLRHVTGSEEKIFESPIVVKEPKDNKGNWKKIFGNDKDIYIEIGMGKGRFIIDNALKYPDINFIGIERYSTVVLKALSKLDTYEKKPENLRFICIDAKELPEVFEKEEVAKIYLNFSDPWPKDRHAKRRLESRQFLSIYEKIIKKDAVIEFKTDNRALFDFALEELKPAGWSASAVTYDLHKEEDLMKDNIMTEYEEKFSSIGNPICKYVIKKSNS
jgi:tRNA (guanine-N7-)-methyltransferase